MTYKTKKAYRKLKAARRELLRHYAEEDLHKLRVALRRTRSLLKLKPGGRARRLREDLGKLADITNPARDWDTLVIRAENLLGREQFNCLQPALAQHQARAHERVRRMLRSRHWSGAVKDLKKHAGQAGFGIEEASDHQRSIALSLHRVENARRRALALGDEGSWHKLRIAVKELRYRLEALPKRSRTPRTDAVLAYCKRLQEDLGAWHDAVIHNRLLCELRERQMNREQVACIDMLCRFIEQERRCSLASLRSKLKGSPGLELA